MTTWDEEAMIPNKAGEAYMRLYHEEWRSTGSFRPKEAEFAVFRGFIGEYRVKIMRNDQVLTDFTFDLRDDTAVDCMHDIILDQLDCFVEE